MSTLKQQLGKLLIPMLPVNRKTFNILRFELNAFLLNFWNGLNPFYKMKINNLLDNDEVSLNLGSGGRGFPGWINTDITKHNDTNICLDIRRGMPFRTESINRIFVEHVLEHIDFREDIPNLLNEFYRILKPNGTLRIVVPDTKRFIQAYLNNSSAEWNNLGFDLNDFPKDMPTPMCLINHVFHQGGEHQFGYDFETFEWALKCAGFKKIIHQSFKKSQDPLLAIDREEHEKYSLYIEAIK